MSLTERDKEFIAEAFIMEMRNENIDSTTALTPENLVFIRKLCAIKHMARNGVNLSLAEATDYIETDGWKSRWAEVWSYPPSPGKSDSVFFTNQYR